jgi:glycosyltransferase involved in cell wall biosynthesis
MNVLVSAYACRPDSGSEPATGWNWAIHLARAGCQVSLLTVARNREAIEASLKQDPCAQLQPHFIDVPWMNPKSSGALHYFASQLLMLRISRRLAKSVVFDVVHHVSYGSVHFPTSLWRLGFPTVFGPVGGGQTAPPGLLSYFGTSASKEWLRTQLTTLLPRLWPYRSRMKRMRLILAANSETARLAENAGCRNVKLLCDTGSRPDFCSEAPRAFVDNRPVRLLWVGRFVPRKGLTLALDALAATKSNVELTLVGEGLSRESIKQLTDARGLTGRVYWEGHRLAWGEVREAYLTSDALFFTSLRDSFGSQNLEAMCVGLPIIALNLGGVRDFVPAEAALKVNPGGSPASTAAKLARALDEFAGLPLAARNCMSEAAWQCGQTHLWTKRAAFAITQYEELLVCSQGSIAPFANERAIAG